MQLYLYQTIIAGIAILMIIIGINNFVKRKAGQTIFKLILRLIIWGGILAIALFPEISSYISDLIGIKNNVNAIILVSIIFILLIIFKLLSAIENVERQITQLVREIALRDVKKDER